jgi:hypothetical protein
MLGQLMVSLRNHAGLRICCGMLLAWFALDFGVLDLSASDCANLTARGSATAATVSADVSTQSAVTATPSHTDDCLCCSHCVEVRSDPDVAPVSLRTIRRSLGIQQVPLLLPPAPYHPPRI